MCALPSSKPAAARQVEARSRARTLGVRVTVVTPEKLYYARSQAGAEIYSLSRQRAGWTCTCKGFTFTGMCKHLGALERRSEREGWGFGYVAPRPGTTDPDELAARRQRRDEANRDLFGL